MQATNNDDEGCDPSVSGEVSVYLHHQGTEMKIVEYVFRGYKVRLTDDGTDTIYPMIETWVNDGKRWYCLWFNYGFKRAAESARDWIECDIMAREAI